MKAALIFAGIGFVVMQTILLLAILAAAARPTPRFEPEMKESSTERERNHEEDGELELV